MNKKFTLIELLVVIAVIGVLMTILMPALRNARIVSMTAVSFSNLKQIYAGSMIYAKSHNNVLFKPNNNPHEDIPNSRTNFGRIVYETIQGRTFGKISDVSQMINGPYKDLMYCPVIRQNKDDYGHGQQGSSDYSMNKYFRGYINVAQITKGVKEPMFAPTTSQIKDNAVPTLRNGTYDPTDNGHLSYWYKSTKSIGVFINGGIKSISVSEGAALDSFIRNVDDFE